MNEYFKADEILKVKECTKVHDCVQNESNEERRSLVLQLQRGEERFMDYSEIKKLMDDMGESKLTELEIEFPDGIKISMKKDDGKKLSAPAPVVIPQAQVPMNTQQPQVPMQVKEGNVVKAPMVGTFYSKSSPAAEPFVKVGSKVKKGDTLCVIEAMKLMNEIESEFDGEIVEILVDDEDMVEYGQPLFIIK